MEKASISATAGKWGAILGVILLIGSILIVLLGLVTQSSTSYVSYVILVGGIVMTFNDFKKQQNGLMSLKEALQLGTITTSISGLISSLGMFVYGLIDDSYLKEILDFQRSEMSKQGLPDDQIEMAMSMVSWMFTPTMMLIIGIIGAMISGFIFSLIIGLIMKKEEESL